MKRARRSQNTTLVPRKSASFSMAPVAAFLVPAKNSPCRSSRLDPVDRERGRGDRRGSSDALPRRLLLERERKGSQRRQHSDLLPQVRLNFHHFLDMIAKLPSEPSVAIASQTRCKWSVGRRNWRRLSEAAPPSNAAGRESSALQKLGRSAWTFRDLQLLWQHRRPLCKR